MCALGKIDCIVNVILRLPILKVIKHLRETGCVTSRPRNVGRKVQPEDVLAYTLAHPQRKMISENCGLSKSRVWTILNLDSPFEDDENDTVDPVFPCTLCGETFVLPSNLKNHERLRHGNKRQRRDPPQQPGPYSLHSGGGAARKRQRRDPTSQPGPSTLQSDANGRRKQKRDSTSQAGPSNLQQVIQFKDPKTKSFPVPPFLRI
ncbi:hypothetical protein AVEN_52591-1 [Araneus ventricosus]|uniref:C2H2-type domain-containing protein n=1 Tax=Araneus ventricosus TaxID=182803 RepID=A0A4Y2ESA7_ARAVE|nr:hypothetical protein AVEN_52591-1 [Araneus ventricosus]